MLYSDSTPLTWQVVLDALALFRSLSWRQKKVRGPALYLIPDADILRTWNSDTLF